GEPLLGGRNLQQAGRPQLVQGDQQQRLADRIGRNGQLGGRRLQNRHRVECLHRRLCGSVQGSSVDEQLSALARGGHRRRRHEGRGVGFTLHVPADLLPRGGGGHS